MTDYISMLMPEATFGLCTILAYRPGKIESTNKHWGIGPITTTVPDAKLHVLEATNKDLPALKLQTSVASSRAIIELSAHSSEVKRYIMSDASAGGGNS